MMSLPKSVRSAMNDRELIKHGFSLGSVMLLERSWTLRDVSERRMLSQLGTLLDSPSQRLLNLLDNPEENVK